jgi:protease-4
MGKDRMQEVVLIDSSTKEKVLVIDINGPISTQRTPGLLNREGDLLSRVYSRLRKASLDPNVKGVILRLDTPGGEGTASDIIYNEVLRFKQKTRLPVVASMMGVAASGGYYIACASDFIFAHPTTITGSIGVIAILPGFKKAMDKIGVEVNVIKSGKMKDAGSPFKEMSIEEKEYFRDMIDNMYRKFLDVVYANRKDHLSKDAIKKLADGRVFHAQKALELKLIDRIGYFNDALDKVLEMANIRDAKVIAYTYHPLKKTNIYANATTAENPLSLNVPLLQNLFPYLKTGIYYLWLAENE